MLVRLKQPLRYNALAVRCKQGSQLHGKEKINRHLLIYLRQKPKLKNGLLDVHSPRICIVIKER